MKKILYDKGLHTDYLAMYLENHSKFINKNIKHIRNVADLSSYHDIEILYFLLIFLFIDRPNFGMTREVLIDKIEEVLEDCISEEGPYNIYGFTLKSIILQDILNAI